MLMQHQHGHQHQHQHQQLGAGLGGTIMRRGGTCISRGVPLPASSCSSFGGLGRRISPSGSYLLSHHRFKVGKKTSSPRGPLGGGGVWFVASMTGDESMTRDESKEITTQAVESMPYRQLQVLQPKTTYHLQNYMCACVECMCGVHVCCACVVCACVVCACVVCACVVCACVVVCVWLFVWVWYGVV